MYTGVRQMFFRARRLWARLADTRRIHAYCVGTGKSGTHSIADIFRPMYRSCHEPQAPRIIETLTSGDMDSNAKRDFVLERDWQLHIEMESSLLMVHFLKTLVQAFPRSQFILTIRDPYSWLNSTINHKLNRPLPKIWKQYNTWLYGEGRFKYAEGDAPLAKRGLYSLESYLSVWQRHNDRVLQHVPEERLLVVRTRELSNNLNRIARFLDVPTAHLNPANTHRFRGSKDWEVVAELNLDYLNDRVNEICGDLMDEYFPEPRY